MDLRKISLLIYLFEQRFHCLISTRSGNNIMLLAFSSDQTAPRKVQYPVVDLLYEGNLTQFKFVNASTHK